MSNVHDGKEQKHELITIPLKTSCDHSQSMSVVTAIVQNDIQMHTVNLLILAKFMKNKN